MLIEKYYTNMLEFRVSRTSRMEFFRALATFLAISLPELCLIEWNCQEPPEASGLRALYFDTDRMNGMYIVNDAGLSAKREHASYGRWKVAPLLSTPMRRETSPDSAMYGFIRPLSDFGERSALDLSHWPRYLEIDFF